MNRFLGLGIVNIVALFFLFIVFIVVLKTVVLKHPIPGLTQIVSAV